MYQAISIDALKALDAIDKKGSFAAAAESLFKVPSALTYTIKKLEDEIGTPLFDRTKQRAVLTPAGKLVLAHGRDILLATNKMVDAVTQLESGWERELRIARDTIIPEHIIFDLLSEFTLLPHCVDVSISEEALGGGWDALHSKRADIVIGASGELPKGMFNIHKISDINFVFAIAPHHPLASLDVAIQAEHLVDYPSIIVSDTSELLPTRESGLFTSKQAIRVNSMRAKLEAQRLGIGVGFLPQHLAQPYLDSGVLIQKACAIPRLSQEMYVAWNKGQDGRALMWFIEKLRQYNWQF